MKNLAASIPLTRDARQRLLAENRATLRSVETGRTDPTFAAYHAEIKPALDEMSEQVKVLELIEELEESKGRALDMLEVVKRVLVAEHSEMCPGDDAECEVCETIATTEELLKLEGIKGQVAP